MSDDLISRSALLKRRFRMHSEFLGTVSVVAVKDIEEAPAEALTAVRDYMVQELLGGLDCCKAVSSGYEWKLKDGRVVEQGVTVKEKDGG